MAAMTARLATISSADSSTRLAKSSMLVASGWSIRENRWSRSRHPPTPHAGHQHRLWGGLHQLGQAVGGEHPPQSLQGSRRVRVKLRRAGGEHPAAHQEGRDQRRGHYRGQQQGAMVRSPSVASWASTCCMPSGSKAFWRSKLSPLRHESPSSGARPSAPARTGRPRRPSTRMRWPARGNGEPALPLRACSSLRADADSVFRGRCLQPRPARRSFRWCNDTGFRWRTRRRTDGDWRG